MEGDNIVEDCNVTFDNLSKVYYAGSVVSGLAKFSLIASQEIRNIYVRIEGFGCIDIEEGDESETRSEDYLDEKVYMVRSDAGKVNILIELKNMEN